MTRKALTLLLLLTLFSFAGLGQVVAVQGDKQIAYICGFTTLKVAVENRRTSKLVVTTNNGKLIYDHRQYCFLPDHEGDANIYISRKTRNGLKLLDSAHFTVRLLPAEAAIGAKSGGPITHREVYHSRGLNAHIHEIGCSSSYRIVGFDVSVMREKKEIFHSTVPTGHGSARFDSATHAFFRKLHNDDRIIFTNIALQECKEPRPLKPIEFTITDAEEIPEHGEEQLEDPVTGELIIRKW